MVPSLPIVNTALTPERLRRYPLILLALTAGVYLISALRSEHWIEPGGRILGRDYFAFYTAGDMIHRGQLDRLYDYEAQETYQDAFMADINPQWIGYYYYRNPPHYAWCMSLIAPLGYRGSLVVWWTSSLACFAATALLWRRWIGPTSAKIPILLAISVPAFFWAFAGGQNTFFSLLILTAFCSLLMSGRDIWAGLVLSLLAFKFYLLAVPIGLLLYKRRWRALLGIAIGGALTLMATLVLLGPQSIVDYLHFGADMQRVGQIETSDLHKQHSWHGLLALLGAGWVPAGSVWILTATATAVSLVCLAAAWRGPWLRHSCVFPLQLAALIIATLLTSPHLNHYDMLIATLPAVLWLRARQDGEIAEMLGGFKMLLAIGFVWLAISPVVSDAIRLQLSPLLMLAWLIETTSIRQLSASASKKPGSAAIKISEPRTAN